MDRLRRALRVFRLRGWRYAGQLVTGHALPRLGAWLVFESRFSELFRRLVCRSARGGVLAGKTPRPPAPGSAVELVSARAWLPQATLETAASHSRPGESTVLGRIDNDGRVLALLGPLPGLEGVDPADFVERYRYGLDLVLDGDTVLIRKDYRGNRRAFLREWRSLAALEGLAGCPAVHRVDVERLRLYKSFVPGPTVRQLLVAAGARILSVDTEADPGLADLDRFGRIEAVWARGRQRFAEALPENFLPRLERLLDAIHRRGVTGFSLTFGNVVLQEGSAQPWLIDFDAVEIHHRPRGLRFAACRDRDRDLFNRIYGRDLVTERTARASLERLSTPYSPIDLGRGLAGRGFWSVDSGTGRWEFLNRAALAGLTEGRRVLDLGSYHALMPLLMLAAGARQVLAVEQDAALVERARELQRLFEWRDARRYDLEVRCADMRAILSGEWGRFDLVTAFCSLYYLSEDDMARVVRRAAELAPILVVQAKTDTREEAADNKAVKSSVAFLRALLEESGFTHVELIAPRGYSRPILIGHRRDLPESQGESSTRPSIQGSQL